MSCSEACTTHAGPIVNFNTVAKSTQLQVYINHTVVLSKVQLSLHVVHVHVVQRQSTTIMVLGSAEVICNGAYMYKPSMLT